MNQTLRLTAIVVIVLGLFAFSCFVASCAIGGEQKIQATGDVNAPQQTGAVNVAANLCTHADIRAKADVDAQMGVMSLERLWTKQQDESDRRNQQFGNIGRLIEKKGISDLALVCSLLGTSFLTAVFCRADDIFKGIVAVINARRDARRKLIADRLAP